MCPGCGPLDEYQGGRGPGRILVILVWKKAATLIETVGGACGLLKWSFPVGMLEQVGRGGDAVWLKGRRGEEVLWRFARASWVVCFRPAGPPSTLLLSSSHSGFIRCWETKTDTFFSVKKLGKKKKKHCMTC